MNLDHVVVVVPELDRAVANYRALGFTVSPGGEHADGRTHNALIVFADGSYVELIAFYPSVAAADHPWWPAARLGGGLADWAIAAPDLAARVKQLQSVGLPYAEPEDGGRLRPDGVRLKWRVARPAPGLGLPFLIEDVSPRPWRVPSGANAEHANGVQGVHALIVAVSDPDAAAAQYGRFFEAPTSGPTPDPLLAAEVVAVSWGTSEVRLASSVAGPINERLSRLGSGPYALVLRTGGDHALWLDPESTCGVPIRVEPAA